MNNIKKYCKYLIDEYLKINTQGENSGFYFRLQSFLLNGYVKEIIFKNSKKSLKIEFLDDAREQILEFAKSQNIIINLYI